MNLVLCIALTCTPVAHIDLNNALQLVTAAGVSVEWRAAALALPIGNGPAVLTVTPSLQRNGFED